MPPGSGKLFIIIGVMFLIIGAWMLWGPRVPWLGRLPGDIRIEGKNTSFYFPVVTCIVISIVLSIIVNLFRK